MKKIWSAVIAVILLAVMASGVYALFSMTVKSKPSKLQAGKVAVEVVGEPVNIGNLTPGSQGEALFEIHNTGTLTVVYSVSWETSGALFEGSNPVQLWSLKDGRMKPGEVNYVNVTWNFPKEAGNEYQGASGTFTLVVNAQQDVGGYPVP